MGRTASCSNLLGLVLKFQVFWWHGTAESEFRSSSRGKTSSKSKAEISSPYGNTQQPTKAILEQSDYLKESVSRSPSKDDCNRIPIRSILCKICSTNTRTTYPYTPSHIPPRTRLLQTSRRAKENSSTHG